ncbi:MAG: HupE/UreJ family protein [Leptolyngbya sp. SIO4C1]|nr:HupE/UreJ family protein [Leptolyngbya sp. SIO4C1]
MLIRSRYLLCSLLTLVCVTLASLYTPAMAHWADLAVADIAVENTQAQIALTIPSALVAFADDDSDQQISAAEFTAHQAAIAQLLRDRIVLTHGAAGPPEFSLALAAQTVRQPTHSAFLLQYRWQTSIESLSIRYDLFPSNAKSAQCLATVTWGDSVRNLVFKPEQPSYLLTRRLPWQQQFVSFLQLGVEHIFTGYDHALFLVLLLLPGGRLVSLVKRVTAFALAHSLTLGLAAFNLITLPTALVESLIALSIVYVAIENLRRRSLSHRLWLTFTFGLVHGLGFANILRDLTGTQGSLALSLASFNLGIELGQLAIVVLAGIILQSLPARRWSRRWRYGLSLATLLIGSLWFVERAIAPIL